MFSPEHSAYRSVLIALVAVSTLLLSSCQKSLKVNAEGFGGGGGTDRAQQRILRQLQSYQTNGVSGAFCHVWSNCERTTSQKQCDRLAAIEEDANKIVDCREFMKRNLADYISVVKQTRVKTVSNPLNITAPDGSIRSLDALVPKGLQEIWIRESMLSDPNLSDEDLTALLMHEYSHLLPAGPGRRQLGDFEAVGQFPVGKDLFDTIGAAIAAESAGTQNEYRKTVLADAPLVYLPMDDRIASQILWDIGGSHRNGLLTGELGFSLVSVPALNTAVQTFPSSSISVEPFSPDPVAGRPFVLELWYNTKTFQRGFGIIAGFDKAALAFQNNILGFSYGDGHVVGTDVTSLTGRWIHIVAKFDPAGLAGSQLYINGVRRQLDHTLGTPTFSTGLFSRVLALNGRPSDAMYRLLGTYDEVAIYDHELSPSRVMAHYTASGSKADLAMNAPGIIGDLEGVRSTAAWDEFKCWNDDCTYELGKSSIADIRQWIGHSENAAYTQGVTKIQRFKFTNLEINKRYRLLGYVANVYGTSDPYYLTSGSGEAQFLVNTAQSFEQGYYPANWNIDFIAKKTTVTISISNGVTSGNSYLSFDAFSFFPF